MLEKITSYEKQLCIPRIQVISSFVALNGFISKVYIYIQEN